VVSTGVFLPWVFFFCSEWVKEHVYLKVALSFTFLCARCLWCFARRLIICSYTRCFRIGCFLCNYAVGLLEPRFCIACCGNRLPALVYGLGYVWVIHLQELIYYDCSFVMPYHVLVIYNCFILLYLN